MPDSSIWDMPASEGEVKPGRAGSEPAVEGSTPSSPISPSETGVTALEEDGNPGDVGSVSSAGREVHVGDLAVTGTGPSWSEPVQPTSRSASRAGRTLGKLGAKKGYAAGIGLQRKKREREKVAAPAVKKTDCPRWMHHRAGVYCKTCGKTP